jgi:putative peptide zinc metalloprotease protein
MISSLPRFRRDLTVSRQASAAGAVFVVKDPVRGRFYRLPEEAHFIADQLDGATPLDVVRARTVEKFGAQLPPQELSAFVRQLDKSGLLESDRQGRARRRQRRIQGSPLYLRVRFFDPDRLFDRWIGRIQFFFTPVFVVFAAAVILTGAGVVAFNWEGIVQNFSRVYQPSVIPLFFAVVFCMVSAHELAHGLTCKQFGGEVHELGFFLIYFQPALYCNVSDAWLFPEKSKRLWVGFAGPFFELFLWGLAVGLWRATDPEAWLNRAAFIAMTTSGIKTLLNFNPLIKLDGYYLLSDWLGIPNLRKRAFACAGDGIKRIFGAGGRRWEQLSARERRILLAYGLTATAGSVAILAVAVTKLGGYLIKNNQPLALLLFTGMLGQKIRRRFNKLFGQSPAAPGEADDEDPPEADGGSDAHAGALPAAPVKSRKKMSRALKRFIMFTAIGGATLAFLIFQKGDLRVGGPFDTLPIRNADVRAGVDGIVSQICVKEGQAVHQGELIARLSDRDNVAQLRQTEADLQAAQAKLALLVNGPLPEQIAAASNEVVKCSDQVRFAASTLARDQLLYKIKLVSQQEYEADQANLSVQRSTLAEAKNQLDLLRAGSRPEDIAAAKALIAQLQAQQSFLQEQIRLARIVSPADGVVATPSRQLHEMNGVFVHKGDLIAKIYDLRTITVGIPVSERDIADVKTGQPVLLKARAYPGMIFHGTVTSIAVATEGMAGGDLTAPVTASAGATSGDASSKTFLVTTEIDNHQLLLKPGMTGQAKIICGKQNLFDLATRQIARTFNVALWSWW